MVFKRLTYTMAAFLASCYFADPAFSNLVVNGSFEQPVLSSGWSVFPSIFGWAGGDGGIEIQADGVGNFTASGVADGEQFVELDTLNENSHMFQDVPTETDTTYLLSFAFAARQLDNRPPSSNDVEVSWEGGHVALLGGPSVPGAFRQEEWSTFSYRVIAESGSQSSRLQFQALGPADGKGGLIDHVSLMQVPEPSTTVLLALGIGAIALRFRAKVLKR